MDGEARPYEYSVEMLACLARVLEHGDGSTAAERRERFRGACEMLAIAYGTTEERVALDVKAALILDQL